MKALLIIFISLMLSSITEYYAQYFVEKEIIEPDMDILTTPPQPGLQRGQRVKVQMDIPVVFKLDKKED